MIDHRLTHRILIALGLGVIIGLILHATSSEGDWVNIWFVNGLLLLIGKWLIALLMLLVVPLVLVSLIKGIGSLADTAQLGKISTWTISLYLATTAIAIATGLLFAWMVAPGQGMGLVVSAQASTTPAPSMMQMLIEFVPNNFFKPMVEGNMLQVIVIAILFGVGLSMINREQPAPNLIQWLDEADRLMLKLISLVMLFVPIGVFALMARSIANLGLDLFIPLMSYALVLITALFFHGLITYGVLLNRLTGVSPLSVFKVLKPMWLFSFSTASSAATIPVTLNTCDRLGISSKLSSFSIPLGATVNMDGTAIMQGVATVFIANAYGITLLPVDYVMILLTATLASIGTAAVPGAGLIMLTMVLTQVGLPVEGIALILGIDRLLDMLRTSVNVTGDVIVSYIVAHKLNLFVEPSQQTLTDQQSNNLLR